MVSLKEKVKRILEYLDINYPKADCSLDYNSPMELLVSVQLSAQCTDKRVNIVAKDLYKKYRSFEDFATADILELENDIKSTGFYRNKAKNIIACSKKILHEYGGKIPDTMEEILKLDGVGRKTANLVLGVLYGRPGVVVDTHVKRITKRLGLTKNDNPDKIENDLMKILPDDKWLVFCHQLIQHGRSICDARKPKCNECGIQDICDFGKR
jgi:endonuclease-3